MCGLVSIITCWLVKIMLRLPVSLTVWCALTVLTSPLNGHPPAGGLVSGLRVYAKWLVTTVCHFEENLYLYSDKLISIWFYPQVLLTVYILTTSFLRGSNVSFNFIYFSFITGLTFYICLVLFLWVVRKMKLLCCLQFSF